MRQKKHKHTLMSDQKCHVDGCRTRIKQNVIDRKNNDAPLVCYAHFIDKSRSRNRGSAS